MPTPETPPQPEQEEQRVTPLELFFDLVFVLSFTQVTATMAEDPSWERIGEGLLILAAVWWAWAAYAWLTNEIDPNENLNRLLVFAAMGGMLVVSLVIPETFGSQGVLFGSAYLVVRLIHLALYVRAGRADAGDGLLRAALGLAPGVLVGGALLIVAGTQEGEVRLALWAAFLLLDYTAPLVAGVQGWHLSPGHFAERHGLVVIIALGESVVAIGVGVGFEINAGEVAAALLAITAICALWWAYFDIVALVAERRLTEAVGGERNALARDSYSYLHLPMIAGIVVLALGLEQTFHHVAEPLKTVPAIALCGGVALYLVGHIAFRLRNVGTLNKHRSVAALAVLALIPLALEAEALVSLAAVTAVLLILIAYEAIRFREARARVRANPSLTLAEMRGRPLGR